MHFDLGEILTRASQITWKHKVLWVFNLFPILFSFLFVPVVFIPMFFIGPYSLTSQGSANQVQYVPLFLRMNLLLIILSLLLYIFGSACSQLGILRIENGRAHVAFWELLNDGLGYFWRMLGTTLLAGAPAAVLLLLVLGLMALAIPTTQGLGLICLVPLFLLMYPAILMGYSVVEQSQAAVMADKMETTAAATRGWNLVRTHFRLFARFVLMIYLGTILLGLVFSLPLILPFIFLFLLSQGPAAGINLQSLGQNLLGLSLLLLPVLALAYGIAMTFIKSAYMLIYRRLTRSTDSQTALQ